MRLRLSDILPSPLSLFTATVMVWTGTRFLQLLANKTKSKWFLLGGLIPAQS